MDLLFYSHMVSSFYLLLIFRFIPLKGKMENGTQPNSTSITSHVTLNGLILDFPSGARKRLFLVLHHHPARCYPQCPQNLAWTPQIL